MNRIVLYRTIICLALLLAALVAPQHVEAKASATSSFAPSETYSWSETTGWLNFGPADGGVVVYPDHLEGYLWAENIGWVKLGSHSTGGNYSYQNSDATNWGINRNASTLSGYGWSETSGWINFAPKDGGGVTIAADGKTLNGWAWGENIGWIHITSEAPTPLYQLVLADPLGLSVTVSGNGTITTNTGDGSLTWNSSTGTASYLPASIVTLTALGASGGQFTGWSGDCSGTDPNCSITLDAPKNVSAFFVLPGNVKTGEQTYSTLAAAYAAAINGNSILARAMTFTESLSFDRLISTTLAGGYDNDSFTTRSGSTVINGTVTISQGSVIMDRIVIR